MTPRAVKEANPNCAQTFASLRLFGDNLVPQEVSRLLQLQPTESEPKGLKTISVSGRSRSAPTGRWVLESQAHVDSTDLEEHIAWVLDRLETSGVIPAEIPGVSRTDVSCFWLSATGTGGPELSPGVLGRLARYHLTLSLDLYFDPS